MSTPTLKLASLAIRTLAKPIATRIKSQARDHPSFRRVCITLAQNLHKIDIRLRVGLLRDTGKAIAAHDAAEKERRRQESLEKLRAAKEATAPQRPPEVRSDELAPNLKEEQEAREKAEAEKKRHAEEERRKKEVDKGMRIRPLSEQKAIDAGANFLSEAFLFAIAAGLIMFETLRSKKKETARKDMVAVRLEMLEDRNRQDEERLEELERRDRMHEEIIMRLEEEVWRLKGGKGEWKPRERGEKFTEWVTKPLWTPEAEKKQGIFSKAWELVTGAPWEGDEEEEKEEQKEREEKAGKRGEVELKRA